MTNVMLSLASTPRPRLVLAMPDLAATDVAERLLMGKALAALRRRRGLSQRTAAEGLGVSVQAYQKFEAGQRRFTEAQIGRVTAALGAATEHLMIERARLVGEEPAYPSRGFHSQEKTVFEIPVWGRTKSDEHGPEVHGAGEPQGMVDLRELSSSSVGATRIAGDTMVPWGEPGELVIFDRDRWPKRGSGCVVETRDGVLFVRLYERSDDAQVFVRQLNPDKAISWPLKDVRGVYSVRLRGD